MYHNMSGLIILCDTISSTLKDKHFRAKFFISSKYSMSFLKVFVQVFLGFSLGSFNETLPVLFTFNEKPHFYLYLTLFTIPLKMTLR